MYKQQNGLTGQPVHVSARRAAVVFLAAALLNVGAGVTGLIAPWLPLLGLKWINIALIAIGVASYLMAVKFWLLYRQIHLEFSWLSKSRFYEFKNGTTPYIDTSGKVVAPWRWKEPRYVSRLSAPLREAFTDFGGVSNSNLEPAHSSRWTVEWPCYRTKRKEVVDPKHPEKKKPIFLKILIANEENTVFLNRAKWLKAEQPERHNLVLAWWRTAYSQVGDPTTESEYYPDYIIGANVGCEPTWWTKKLGHGIDFEPIALLQTSLRKLSSTRHANVTQPPALPTQPVPDDFYAGKGFLWQGSHLQKMLWHQQFDSAEAGKSPDQGDGRWYAVGVHNEHLVFKPRKTSKQHYAILGATGVGKTRLIQQITDQLTRSGDRMAMVDPKGDEELQDQIVTAARESGRAHKVRIFNLVLPNNHNFCTMNVCGHFDQSETLGNRLGSVIAQTSDEYWRDKAIQVARDVFSVVVACHDFLRILGVDRTTGQLPDKHSTQVPMVLLALQWAATHPGCTPQQAEAGVKAVLAKRDADKNWSPSTAEELNIIKLAAMKEYTPLFWCPTIQHVSSYAIDKTTMFLAMLLKVAHFHSFIDITAPKPAGVAPGNRAAPPPTSAIPAFSAPDFALTAPVEAITGKASGGAKPPPMYLTQVYREAGLHPLERRLTDNRMPLNPSQEKWQAFYDYFVPAVPDTDEHQDDRLLQSDQLTTSLVKLKNQITTITAFAELDRSDFLQQVSTLQSGLARFKGAKERIISAPKPDIDWEEMINDRLIIYINLGSLIDRDAAGGLAKMIMSNLMAYAGEVYHFHQNAKKDPPPWYIFGDEYGRWGNMDTVEMAATGRGAGVNFIIAAQTRADFVSALGTEHAAQQLEGNVNTVYQMRAAHPNDAEEFTRRCGKIPVKTKNLSNRLTSDMMGGGNRNIDIFSGDFTVSLNQEQKDSVPPEFSMQLPQGQVLCSLLGGEVYLLSIGMFPRTEVSIKEEYGTLTDNRDLANTRRVAAIMNKYVESADAARSQAVAAGVTAPVPLPFNPASVETAEEKSVAPAPQTIATSLPTSPTNPPVAPVQQAPHAATIGAPPPLFGGGKPPSPPQVAPPSQPIPAPTIPPQVTTHIPATPPPSAPPPLFAPTSPASPAPVPSAGAPATPRKTTMPAIKVLRKPTANAPADPLAVLPTPGIAPVGQSPIQSPDPTAPASAGDSTVGLPGGSPGTVHLPPIPTADPKRSDSIGGGSPFALDD